MLFTGLAFTFSKRNHCPMTLHNYTLTRLTKDNGPASKVPRAHNECMLHFHKFHKVS